MLQVPQQYIIWPQLETHINQTYVYPPAGYGEEGAENGNRCLKVLSLIL